MHDDPPPPPVFQAPPPDPTLVALQQQSENQNIIAMKNQAMQDTSHLMQQYGIINALAGSGASLANPTGAVTAMKGA